MILMQILFFYPSASSISSATSIEASQITFTDITAQALGEVPLARTFGLCVADINNDGNDDIFIGNHLAPIKLYYNNGTFPTTFTQPINPSIVKDFHGCAWGDYDNDGDTDLYLTIGAGAGTATKENFLLRNDVNTLANVAVESGVTDPKGRGRSAGWFDYDNDGDIDLMIVNANRSDGPNRLYMNNGDSTFTERGAHAGVADITPDRGLSFADYNLDGYTDIFITSGSKPLVYKNLGDGTFMESSIETGITSIANSTGSVWGDFDNDLDMDLFITASNGLGDAIYFDTELLAFDNTEKNGIDHLVFTTLADNLSFDLYFKKVSARTDLIFIGQGNNNPLQIPFTLNSVSGIDPRGKPTVNTELNHFSYLIWLDESNNWHIENHGHTTDPENSIPLRLRAYITGDNSFTDFQPINYEFRNPTARNYLFENLGNGGFQEITSASGLTSDVASRSALASDFDNDGDLDIYVVRSGDVTDAPNAYYVNNGDLTFTENAALAGIDALTSGMGDAAATGDFNNDGFMDLFLVNGYDMSTGPYILLENNGNGNNWLKIRLQGTTSNSSALGAKIFLFTPAGTLFREQNGGYQLHSQNDQTIHFGLGPVGNINRLKIIWPSGKIQNVYGLSVNNSYTIVESPM